MDDSSHLITCYGIFDAPTTENPITALNQGFPGYGMPREILTDNGTQFVSDRNREHAHHSFGEFLKQHDIKHILAGVKHPQTNGKIERFFGEVERRIKKVGSIDAIVYWHNVIKPHMSLDYDEPCNALLVPIASGVDPGICTEMVHKNKTNIYRQLLKKRDMSILRKIKPAFIV